MSNTKTTLAVLAVVALGSLYKLNQLRGGGRSHSQGSGNIALALETDADSIRHALWYHTDRIFKGATKRFAQIKTNLKVKVEEEYDLFLRLCDVEGALKLRPFANLEHPVSLTLQVSDSSAPWNEGVWRVEVADGATNVEKTSGEADLTLSATALAPIFNGYISPSGAALAGLITARDEESLATADALFATSSPPFCADGF